MRWFGSIESRHGVDEPGYQPPTDPPVLPQTERRGFGPIDALWCVLIPLIGVVMAVTRFARDELGPGFACLLCSAVGFAGWSLVVPAVADARHAHHHARHHTHHVLRHHHRAHKTDVEEDDPLPWEEEVLEGDAESDGSESCATVPGPCTVVEG